MSSAQREVSVNIGTTPPLSTLSLSPLPSPERHSTILPFLESLIHDH